VHYLSTRGLEAPAANTSASFEDVLLSGLARDGGLYVPASWPWLEPTTFTGLAGLDYAALAARLLAPFTQPSFDQATLAPLATESYQGFGHPATAPLIQIAPNRWLLELFHGPTLAFKDYALQLLGRLFDHALAKRGARLTIVGATSGDTGSAAITACQGRTRLRVIILHPKGRVSEVQRRQMTTVKADNVHNLAIEGTFDDCQTLIKALFNDLALKDELSLGAINSINWARIAAQLVYYAYAALRLGTRERPVSFVVPTGNFGNVYAGYVARLLGLPIGRLHVATNRNDILARFFATGSYVKEGVRPSISPSMDIEVASNFERLLFELHGRDGAMVRRLMEELQAKGRFQVDGACLAEARAIFGATRADDAAALAAIARVHAETGLLIDPHSAAGIVAADALAQGPAAEQPLVCLATAHPAKFPDAVERATGRRPALPAALADLLERPEQYDTLPNDLAAVRAYVRRVVGRDAPGRGAREKR
jgi:threonine synthase